MNMEKLQLILTALWFLACAVDGQIRILQPPEIAEKFPHNGLIKGSTAAFGTPYWGDQLIAKLAYNVSLGNEYCSEEDYSLPPHEDSLDQFVDGDEENGRHFPRIVLVRRGKCHFAQKVKIAQDTKGASAVIIVDEEGSPRTPVEVRSIIMADDGLGPKIRIPSILISDNEGSQLIDAMKTGQDILVELMWDIPNESIVEVNHWMSPGISTSINFLSSFASYARTMKHRMNFKPHFFVFNLPSDANSMCLDASAKYCSMAPDWHDPNVTGQQVVYEILRQSCLWLTTKSIDMKLPESGEYSEAFWNYIEKAPERCLHPMPISPNYSERLTEKCSYDLMRELHIDPMKVQACIQTLGTSQLSSDLYNHAWSPTAMMINNARFAGPLDAFVVAKAICTGFTREPEGCTALKSRHIQDILFHEDAYIMGESYAYGSKGGVAWWVYFLSIFLSILFCIGMVVAYRCWLIKQLKNELRYEVFEEVKSQIGGIHPNNYRDISSNQKGSSLSGIEVPGNRCVVEG